MWQRPITWLVILLRAAVACLLIGIGYRTQSVVFLVYGLGEVVAVGLGIWNEIASVDRDTSRRGYIIPAMYLLVDLTPPRGPGVDADPTHVYTTAAFLLVLNVARVGLMLGLGRSFTVGGSTWVGLHDRGPYRVVRHPLILVTLAIRIAGTGGIPSPWNLISAGLAFCYAFSVIDAEESYLRKFQTYREYAKRVPYRLIPKVW